jgi:hypothetical protein
MVRDAWKSLLNSQIQTNKKDLFPFDSHRSRSLDGSTTELLDAIELYACHS